MPGHSAHKSKHASLIQVDKPTERLDALPPAARREAARQRLAQRFSWATVTKQLLDLL